MAFLPPSPRPLSLVVLSGQPSCLIETTPNKHPSAIAPHPSFFFESCILSPCTWLTFFFLLLLYFVLAFSLRDPPVLSQLLNYIISDDLEDRARFKYANGHALSVYAVCHFTRQGADMD